MSAGNEGEGGRRKGGSGEEVNVLCSFMAMKCVHMCVHDSCTYIELVLITQERPKGPIMSRQQPHKLFNLKNICYFRSLFALATKVST